MKSKGSCHTQFGLLYHNTIGQLVNNSDIFLTVLRLRSSRSRCQGFNVWWTHLPGSSTAVFSLPPPWWGVVVRGLSGASFIRVQFSSVQFSRSVVSDSLRHHESQHARPPCPSPTPGVHSDSRPSGQWCHPAISYTIVPFFSCPQSLPASGFSNESTLRVRWLKYWSFSFSIILSRELPGLISFRMD